MPVGRFFEQTAAAKRTVELGFGRADWLFTRAREEPERQFLGLEAAPAMASVAVRRALRERLPNLFLAFGDARLLLIENTPPCAIDELVVLFPDPWHKKRQRKRRITAPEMLPFIVRALALGGTFRFRTDHASLFYDTVIAGEAAGLTHGPPRFNRDPAKAVTAWEAKSLDGRSKHGGTIAEIVFVRPPELPAPSEPLESPIDPREPVNAEPLSL